MPCLLYGRVIDKMYLLYGQYNTLQRRMGTSIIQFSSQLIRLLYTRGTISRSDGYRRAFL